MSALILPSRFTRQPPYPARVKPEYSGGSIFVAPGYDAANGTPVAIPSTLAVATTTLGKVITNASQTSNAVVCRDGIKTANWSAVFVGSFVTGSSSYDTFAQFNDDGYALKFGNSYGGSNTFGIVIPFMSNYFSSIANRSGVPCVLAFLGTNGANYDCIVRWLDTNQVVVETGVTFGSPILTAGTSYLLSEVTAPYTCGANSTLALAGIIPRRMPVAEALSVVQNPWQIFKAPPRFFFAPSSGDSVSLAGNAQAIASATGALSVAVPISGAAVGVVTASGALSTAMPISGAAAAVAVAAGNLTLGLSLAGPAIAAAVASGALGVGFPLAGNAQAAAAATGNLGSGAGLAGAAVMAASATGSIQVQISLSGAAIAQAAATGNLVATGSSALAGNAQVQASASGILSTNLPLAGNAQVVAAASGNLTKGVPLSGAAVAVVTALGNLTVTATLSGAAVAQAIATGGLALSIPLAGAAIMHAIATGYLSVTGGTGPVGSVARSFSVSLEDRSFILEAEFRQAAASLQ